MISKKVLIVAVSLFLLLLMPYQNIMADGQITNQMNTTSTTNIHQYQHYYDNTGRLDRICSQFIACTLLSYDSNGNLLSRGKTRSVSLPNPGFENGTSDVGYYIGKGSLSLDTANYSTGIKSIKVIPSLENEGWLFETHQFGTDVTGRTFSVSAEVKTRDLVGGVHLLIYWLDTSGNWIWSNITSSNTLTGNNDWTKLSATSIAPYGATAVTAMVASYAGSGTYWVDSLTANEQSAIALPFPNPSFENGTTEVGYFVGKGSLGVDTANYVTGKKSIKVNPCLENEAWVFETHRFGTDVTGRKFTVSADVKTQDLVGGVHLMIYWLDASGNWIWSNITSSTTLTGNNNWTKLSTTSVAPNGAIAVTVMLASYTGSGAYWIDSLEGIEQ